MTPLEMKLAVLKYYELYTNGVLPLRMYLGLIYNID